MIFVVLTSPSLLASPDKPVLLQTLLFSCPLVKAVEGGEGEEEEVVAPLCSPSNSFLLSVWGRSSLVDHCGRFRLAQSL